MRRSRTLRQIGWRSGFQVSELPSPVAVWLVGWTAFAGLEGDLTSPGGLVGLGFAILELAGLVVLFRRSLRARPAVAEALRTGLAQARRAPPAQEPASQVLHGPSTRSLLLPLAAEAGCDRVYLWPLGDEPRQVELAATTVLPAVEA